MIRVVIGACFEMLLRAWPSLPVETGVKLVGGNFASCLVGEPVYPDTTCTSPVVALLGL